METGGAQQRPEVDDVVTEKENEKENDKEKIGQR